MDEWNGLGISATDEWFREHQHISGPKGRKSEMNQKKQIPLSLPCLVDEATNQWTEGSGRQVVLIICIWL